MVVCLEQGADNSMIYELCDLHTIFYSRLSVSKSIFYVSVGNNFFTVFCRGPLVVEAPGQLPSLPPPLNPALHGFSYKQRTTTSRRITKITLQCCIGHIRSR